jgi:DNA-binding NtrC family response regulator
MSRVLVIDDDEMVLKALSIYLSGSGFTILTTADGPQGITIYNQEKPDVVILDIGLPSLDGLEVLKQLKRSDPNAKIIICSGYGSATTIDEAMQNGAYAFLNKPFDVEAMIRLIVSALRSESDSPNTK